MSAFEKAYILDAQDIRKDHEDVYDEIRKIWADKELGNDVFYSYVDAVDTEDFLEFEEQYPATAKYIREHCPEPEIGVYLHFWW